MIQNIYLMIIVFKKYKWIEKWTGGTFTKIMTVVRVMGNFHSYFDFPVFSTPSTINIQLFDNQKAKSNLAFLASFSQ